MGRAEELIDIQCLYRHCARFANTQPVGAHVPVDPGRQSRDNHARHTTPPPHHPTAWAQLSFLLETASVCWSFEARNSTAPSPFGGGTTLCLRPAQRKASRHWALAGRHPIGSRHGRNGHAFRQVVVLGVAHCSTPSPYTTCAVVPGFQVLLALGASQRTADINVQHPLREHAGLHIHVRLAQACAVHKQQQQAGRRRVHVRATTRYVGCGRLSDNVFLFSLLLYDIQPSPHCAPIALELATRSTSSQPSIWAATA